MSGKRSSKEPYETRKAKQVKRVVMEQPKVETMIKLVKGQKSLWKTDETAFNTEDKPKVWDIIGETVGYDGKKCANEWKNLMSDFRANLKEEKLCESEEREFIFTFHYYDLMAFVKPYAESRRAGKRQCNASKYKDDDASESSDEGDHPMDECYDGIDPLDSLVKVSKEKKKKSSRAPCLVRYNDGNGTLRSSWADYMKSILPVMDTMPEIPLRLFRGHLMEVVMQCAYAVTGLYAPLIHEKDSEILRATRENN